MECIICKKEFIPARKNQTVCSDACKKEKARRYQAEHWKKWGKKNRKLTEEQIEKNRERNRNKYRDMSPEEKEKFLKKARERYHQKKKM